MHIATRDCPVFVEALENRTMLSVAHAAAHHVRHSPPPLATQSAPPVITSLSGSGTDPIYMQISGITGEVTTVGFVGAIELHSFSWGITNTTHSTSGAGHGKVSFSDVQITKTMDSTSSKLVQTAMTGKSIKEVNISFVTFNADQVATTYAKYTFTNCIISGYSVSSGGDRPTESLSLNFAKVKFVYSAQTATGAPARVA
jgi:type VI secretion system secreted protein Hcp